MYEFSIVSPDAFKTMPLPEKSVIWSPLMVNPLAPTKPFPNEPAFVPSTWISGFPLYPGWLVPSMSTGIVMSGRVESGWISCTPLPGMLKSITFGPAEALEAAAVRSSKNPWLSP